jgi:hypothetical protein
MATTKAKKETGSEKMAARGSAPTTGGTSQGALAKALASLNKSGLKNDILIKGIPIPNVIRGTITAATPSQAGSALGTLLKIKNIQYKPVKLFPKGIPVIDEIVLQIDGKIGG